MKNFFDFLEDIVFIISQISECVLIILIINGCYYEWFLNILCFDLMYYFWYREYC